jgi:fructose transport system substrate-binding protein
MKPFRSAAPGRGKLMWLAALATTLAVGLAACGSSGSSDSSSSSGSTGSDGKTVKVALILKTFSDPYFVSMEKSAKAAAEKLGVELEVSAGQTGSDTGPQITAIDNAIAAGDNGILIVSNGDAVNSALEKARTAGLYTIALDTPLEPPSTVDLTYATDNVEAGQLIGKWAGAKLDGESADIAMLDALSTEVISVDVERDHGFLEGIGIPVGDPHVNGKEPTSGNYTGGKGGEYEIACQLASEGSIGGGKSAMQTCLQKDSGINLVYAVNEPAAIGAVKALEAEGHEAAVVTIDGGCENLPYVKSGAISATAGQFPGKMAEEGVNAIYGLVTKNQQPKTSPGLDYFNTGTKLYTEEPQSGVPSVNVEAAEGLCWGQ